MSCCCRRLASVALPAFCGTRVSGFGEFGLRLPALGSELGPDASLDLVVLKEVVVVEVALA